MTLSSTPAPPTGAVGLADHALGVKMAAETSGPSCSRVDGLAEALTITLAGTSGRQADRLRRARHRGVQQRDRPGSEPTSARRWSTPRSCPPRSRRDRSGARTATTGGSSTRASPFDRLVLSVDPSTPAGAFSLEGGKDGLACRARSAPRCRPRTRCSSSPRSPASSTAARPRAACRRRRLARGHPQPGLQPGLHAAALPAAQRSRRLRSSFRRTPARSREPTSSWTSPGSRSRRRPDRCP